jgi:hypothetical protein
MQDENLGNGIINPFPGQACEWVDYSQGSGDSDDPNHSDVRGFTQDPNLATAVTSRVLKYDNTPINPFDDGMDIHKVVIDLDLDAKLVPSSTPGHHHLFINKPMRWDQLVRLLCVLAEVGILEPGYVSACIAQGHTSVRLPHVRKPGVVPASVPGETVIPATVVRQLGQNGNVVYQDSGANLEVAQGVVAPHATTVDLSHLFPR